MYRTTIKQLIQWKINKNKKPLVFLGTRQVGKTYLLKEFGKQEYRQVVYINFERAEKMKSVFLQDLDQNG
jgi:predicted AAA+ superfamily ATPase